MQDTCGINIREYTASSYFRLERKLLLKSNRNQCSNAQARSRSHVNKTSGKASPGWEARFEIQFSRGHEDDSISGKFKHEKSNASASYHQLRYGTFVLFSGHLSDYYTRATWQICRYSFDRVSHDITIWTSLAAIL